MKSKSERGLTDEVDFTWDRAIPIQ